MAGDAVAVALAAMAQRRSIAAATAVALVLVSIPLAAPGLRLVPGAEAGAPGWITGPYGDGFGLSPDAYRTLLHVAVAIWAAALVLAEGLGRRPLAIVTGGLIALFALSPPLLSLDLFSYISYARLGAEHGFNPYAHPPAAIPADEAAMRVRDFSDAVSVYGPVFTLLSYPLALLGVPAALWSLKAIAAASLAAIAVLCARLARLRGLAPEPAVALVALNPLMLVHLVGGGHNDALMILLAMLAVAAALTARPALAGVGLVAAIAVKAAGALYAPFAIVGSPAAERRRMLLALLAAAAATAVAGLAAFGPGVLEAVGVAGGNQDTISHWSVPATLARASGTDVDAIRAVLAVAYAASLFALLLAAARGADWVRAAGWAAFGLLVASAYMAPWYLIWLLPLAAISRDRWLVVASVALTALQVANGVPL